MRPFLVTRLPLLLCFLYLPGSLAQQPPVDAADISRDLLYHPARAIESRAGAVVFRAAEFTYTLDSAAGSW